MWKSVSPDEETVTEGTTDELPAADNETEEVPLDIIFEVLKNARRRQVVQYLNERCERVSLSDLAEHIAALENDTTPEMLTSQQRKRVYIALYQCHLPKLDSTGMVNFDSDRGHVELGHAADQLDKYLSIDEDNSRPWFRPYVGFAIISALTLWLGVVTTVVTAGGAAVLFGGLCVGITVLAIGRGVFSPAGSGCDTE